jgi:1,4-dihydroxy-6-naphthoate synthase
MILKVGFSPCPNDTFIFAGMVHGFIDTEGLEIDPYLADVEELNTLAGNSVLDITKLSYHAFSQLLDQYQLLSSGSALGFGVGPLLVSSPPENGVKYTENELSEILEGPIAIPGKLTTAFYLLKLAFPRVLNVETTLFSEVENTILSGKCRAGLIIHENRFTYESKGLFKVMDLGEYWEKETGLPIPLGGIVVKKELEEELKLKLNRVLRRSIEFAFKNPDKVMPYVREHAQAMDDLVMRRHIELYVNGYTINLGELGIQAVKKMFQMSDEKKITENTQKKLFIIDS